MVQSEMQPPKEEKENTLSGKRPVLLSVLCLFAWTYYGIMASLFFLALFFSESITGIINQYIPDEGWSALRISSIFLGMFLLHAVAFSGIILLWYQKAAGYYLFAIPSIAITVVHLFRPEISWFTTAVYALCVILFGLFFRRMKNGHVR